MMLRRSAGGLATGVLRDAKDAGGKTTGATFTWEMKRS